MKKTLRFLAAVCLCALMLAACESREPLRSNSIEPTVLTAEEQTLKYLLLGGRREILLFSYHTGEDILSEQIWLDTYEMGQLTGSDAISHRLWDPGTKEVSEGRLALHIEYGDDDVTYWVAIAGDSHSTSGLYTAPKGTPAMYFVSGLTEPAPVATGESAVLAVAAFSDDHIPMRASWDLTNYHEYLPDFSHVHVIRYVLS